MNTQTLGQRLGGLDIRNGDILSARFFAPKISDVSDSPVKQAGWRKIVRIKSKPKSDAFRKQISSAIVLFNFLANIGDADPFAHPSAPFETPNRSVNTQVILVSSAPGAQLYWLDFDPHGRLTHELDAFFDAGHVVGKKVAYFVPCACISCHGGLQLDMSQKAPIKNSAFRSPMLDYLDTDHWADRVEEGDDFHGLVAPTIFDPGGFDVIRKINTEIEQQNEFSQPLSPQQRAAEHWLELHQFSDTHVDIFERSILRPQGAGVWRRDDPLDAQLLPKLNRYCFRCHGSVEFDIFDRGAVTRLKASLDSRLQPRDQLENPAAGMPPDRSAQTLTADDLARLRDLIKALPDPK